MLFGTVLQVLPDSDGGSDSAEFSRCSIRTAAPIRCEDDDEAEATGRPSGASREPLVKRRSARAEGSGTIRPNIGNFQATKSDKADHAPICRPLPNCTIMLLRVLVIGCGFPLENWHVYPLVDCASSEIGYPITSYSSDIRKNRISPVSVSLLGAKSKPCLGESFLRRFKQCLRSRGSILHL